MLKRRCRHISTSLIAGALLASGALAPPTAADDSLGDALKGGTASFDLRYRYERVDQDGFSRNAAASTARLRLGYETANFHRLSARFEFEGLETVGSERYNSTANGLTQFPVVADPEDAELNQAWLAWAPRDGIVFRLGRQRITLDNHRFVGNVGWRQLEQTYDGVSAWVDFTKDLSLTAGYLTNANRVFGEHNPDPALADLDLAAPLLRLSYRAPVGTVTGYVYLIERRDAPAASHKSVGIRFDGRHAFDDRLSFLYTLELADQSDYKDGAASVDAGYRFAEAGVALKNATVKIGFELLEGDGTYAFQTPLATLHAFNGWADQFLTTPPDGIRDTYVLATGSIRGIRLTGAYHAFSADRGGADYAGEIDLEVAKTFSSRYTAALTWASYDADTFAVDVDKLWASLQVTF